MKQVLDQLDQMMENEAAAAYKGYVRDCTHEYTISDDEMAQLKPLLEQAWEKGMHVIEVREILESCGIS